MNNKTIILVFLGVFAQFFGMQSMQRADARLKRRSADLRVQLHDREVKLKNDIAVEVNRARWSCEHAWLAGVTSLIVVAVTGYRAAIDKAGRYDAGAMIVAFGLGFPYGFASAHAASAATDRAEAIPVQLAEVATLNAQLNETDALLASDQAGVVADTIIAQAEIKLNLLEETLKSFDKQPENLFGKFVKDLWSKLKKRAPAK